jgi:hypothetical protein
MKPYTNQLNEFLEQHPECQDRFEAAGKCNELSSALLKVIDNSALIRLSCYIGHSFTSRSVWKLHPAYWEHTVLICGEDIIDVTARQFDPNFPVPRITTLRDLMFEWNEMKLVG